MAGVPSRSLRLHHRIDFGECTAATIKPIALLPNLGVSAQGSVQFWQAGHLR